MQIICLQILGVILCSYLLLHWFSHFDLFTLTDTDLKKNCQAPKAQKGRFLWGCKGEYLAVLIGSTICIIAISYVTHHFQETVVTRTVIGTISWASKKLAGAHFPLQKETSRRVTSILPTLIHKFNRIPIKISIAYLIEQGKTILNSQGYRENPEQQNQI